MLRKRRHAHVSVELPFRIRLVTFLFTLLIGLAMAFVFTWIFLSNLAPAAAEFVRSIIPNSGTALLAVAGLGVVLGSQIYGLVVRSWERKIQRHC